MVIDYIHSQKSKYSAPCRNYVFGSLTRGFPVKHILISKLGRAEPLNVKIKN